MKLKRLYCKLKSYFSKKPVKVSTVYDTESMLLPISNGQTLSFTGKKFIYIFSYMDELGQWKHRVMNEETQSSMDLTNEAFYFFFNEIKEMHYVS